jgi:crotonobetainyl-CoA:carnitine CoA-transferase CaiB-like acyl-CoA transferase
MGLVPDPSAWSMVAYRRPVHLPLDLPLEGIRVVDMSSVVMGPLATQLLADQGADVIVIEDRRGDTNRAMGPGPHPDLSGVSLNLMRNKRSVGLDVRHPDGYRVLLRLIATADVFVTNLRPGSRARARITYDDLRTVRPDLVYCAAAGYPVDSDLADQPAYDDVIQAGSGIADLTERVGLPPSLLPTLVADKTAGLVIANMVTGALFRRERTGEGREISIAMSEVMRAYILAEHGAAAIPEPPLGSAGYPRILNPMRRPQTTADGWISVLPYERHHYEALFRLGGRDDLLGDERILTRKARLANGESLYRDIAEILTMRSTAEWLAVMRETGIPASPVTMLDDLVNDLPFAEHPHGGTYRVIPPLTGSTARTGDVRRPAPLPGEHGIAVLTELGFSRSEIDALVDAEVLHGAFEQ